MKAWFYDPVSRSVHEVDETAIPVPVCASVRGLEDGVRISAVPELLDAAQLLEKTLLWIQDNVNPVTLPEELQPLRLRILQTQATLAKTRT